jgi:hypothetical protein
MKKLIIFKWIFIVAGYLFLFSVLFANYSALTKMADFLFAWVCFVFSLCLIITEEIKKGYNQKLN